MQLVELETQGNKKVWVNPDYIITIAASAAGGSGLTDIYLVGTDPKHPVTFKGPPADLAKKINDALKA